MQAYLEVIKSVGLFAGIEANDLLTMLTCLGATKMEYPKGTFVLMSGEKVVSVGVLLEGQLHITKEDLNGDRALIATLAAGDVFAEALCFAGVAQSPVSVVAAVDSKVLLLNFRRIVQTCSHACTFHTQLIENMLHIIAQKNLQLQARMDFLSKKSIRERLMNYLEAEALKQGRTFSVPQNREELADFLCVDRSALSRELGNLKREGILDYHKNFFRLL